MQTQGTLQESNLASLLQTMQTERATGALALESQSGTASLYFLFGHLFHAASPSGQGEDVVLQALSWHEGSFRFDPRAKLPPEETIKSSPLELIAEAERRAPAEQAGWGGAPGYDESQPYQGAGYSDQGVGGYADPGWTPPEQESVGSDSPAAAGYSPWAPPTPEPIPSEPVYEAPAQYEPPEPLPAPARAQYRLEPSPTAAAAPVPALAAIPTPVPVPAPAQAPGRAAAHAAAPARTPTQAPTPVPAPAAQPSPTLGAPAVQPLDIVYPLPSGRAQYEGLKSAFVDFPKLLRTLRADQHTGYIRLTAPDFAGILLFHEGHLLEALSSIAGARSGEAAFQAMRRSMDAGTGGLDVIDLAGETVEALAQLLTAPLLYTGLLGRFINFDALIAFLNEEGVEGAVLVVGAADIGIILLSHGKVLGAYTQTSPALNTATTGVAKIATDKTARIEVKSGAGSVVPLDVENALSRAY
ncbi:MAG: DUF4388 domain-containing protein [Candidatus Dormibacteria bacterium]